MWNLTSSQGVLDYLSNTRFAATSVQRLVGGFNAFTYRVKLLTPLEDGSTTLIVKHYEGYVAFAAEIKLESDFEYDALVTLWDCGLVNNETIVRAPRPIHYDRDTHTIFISDLGSDVVNLSTMFDEHLQRACNDSDRMEIENMAFDIGSALGDFLGRLHTWGTSTKHQKPFLHHHRRERIFALFSNLTARSANNLGVKEGWLESMLSAEMRKVSVENQVLAMGDLSLNNILVHRVPDRSNLRIYVVDWELFRPACRELDLGEITGTWLSFAHYRRINVDFPFLPSLYKAYQEHHKVDRTRIAILSGMFTMGLGTTASWVRDGGDEIYKQTALVGYEVMKLAHEGEDRITSAGSPLKMLFD
ncbi:hypothetical protein BN14_03969 [Rhizoctonia solani AG-1 IB]|uniref:Aminoglycoside phosphotransferase domain-containing protein n=2 Tax=Rhizoctonia solani TaxID=456999 RepID=A0A8H2WJH2_9AGAM|nr:unnamed protein product [Rhizoctonia solani]CCO29945.1 hypothetical protein BN14_03969 [Rhizoctonia solani AG-1 IB]